MISSISTLVSTRLQGAELFESPRNGAFCIVLQFYTGRKLWLVLDVKQARLADEIPVAVASIKPSIKPIILFMRSHFFGHSVIGVESSSAGLKLYFPLERSLQIQFHAHDADITASAQGKHVAQKIVSQKIAKGSKDESELPKRLVKLERALSKIDADLASKRDELWSKAGEWLLGAQTLENPPADIAACLDFKKTFSWNLNHCFEKSKQVRGKIHGTTKRRDEIAKQVDELKEAIARGETFVTRDAAIENKSARPTLLAQAKSHGRTYEVDKFSFFVGKSAQDNLRLLRVARPWHLWLHLKDYPGSHGILQINKGERVSDSALHQAADYLLKTQFGDKASRHANDKFDILVAECRFVRPIKGDHIGRVNYSNARTLIHHFVLQKS